MARSEPIPPREGSSAMFPAEQTHSIQIRVADAARRVWRMRASRDRSRAPEVPLMAAPLAASLLPKWMTSASRQISASSGQT